MNITPKEVKELRSVFAVCRITGIDAVVVTDNMVRGITADTKVAVFAPVKFKFDEAIKIGIGRISELEKRFGIFGDAEVNVECKLNDSNEVSVMSAQAGKAKVQFRCTAERLIKYAKSNNDDPVCTVKATKTEVLQVSRAVKTLAAEHLTLAIGRDGSVRFECSSPTNELFVAEIEARATFENDLQAIVHTYQGDRFASILDAAVRDEKDLSLVVGDFGSITLHVGGHMVTVMPEANNEDGDDDE